MNKAPELPAESSFIMDLSVIFLHVAIPVAAIPVASFIEAFKHNPESQSDGSCK